MNTNARMGKFGAFCFLLSAIIALSFARDARAQATLYNEGFEGTFPGAWTVGDSNASSGLVYWDDVLSSFGSGGVHSGSRKGYCAGIGFIGPSATPRYTNNMQAVMSRTINLTGFTGANVEFWYLIPSIEVCCDSLRVFGDSNLLWSTSATQASWARMTLPLTALAGGSHTLRFEFVSDISVIAEGAYLDDILVRAHTAPFASTLNSLNNANYSGYVLASDTFFGRSNIQAQAQFAVENFTGTNTTYSNVLSFRLMNAATGLPHPIYDLGNATTNASYTYNITNAIALAAGTNTTVTANAFIRPAAFMSQFAQFYLECRMITNGVLAQTLTTAAQTFYHFTNTVSGDAALNVLGNLTGNVWSRTFAVQTSPSQRSFQVQVNYDLYRWDDFNAGVSSANIPVVFNYTLRDATGSLVPLVNNSQSFLDALNNYFIFFFATPEVISTSKTLDIEPAVQLDSVNKRYYLTVTLAHTNNPISGQVLTANSRGTTTNELLHFNGNLLFSSITTRIDSLGAAPPANPPVGGVIPTTLGAVNGTVTGSPTHTFSGGPLTVNLNPVGDAIVTGGSVVLNAPSPDVDSVARVRFRRGPVSLKATGAFADVRVTLPAGFGYRTNNTSSKVTYSMIQFIDVALNSVLDPASDLVFDPNVPIYAAEETKPAWLLTDRILWRIASGKFEMPPVGVGAIYVRATEYALLQSVSNSLVDPPNMADKRSNERYWLSLNGVGALTSMRPDSGSNALLTTAFKFSPGGFRAHFPYDTYVEWSGSGDMNVADDFVLPGTSSALNGAKPVAVPYTKECPGCAGAALPPAMPEITSSNNLFGFTRDGGIVAGGPTTGAVDLQWGYISSLPNYAQQALTFNQGAFHMPGAFLRGDQNLLPDVHGPTTILFTGFAVSNLVRIERPLSNGYTEGYSDYAGLNFRCLVDSAHNAKSTIAGTPNIGWKLDARSKYYVRYSGVTGIHEAVPGTFPSTLTLWGYSFTFTSYGLSYRDSQNIDSVTDGAVNLPYPSDFIQNFEKMKFSCLGAPLNAEVPFINPFKLMSYWQADFKTHAIKFTGPNNCDPSQGYLVLSIEGYASHVDKPLYGNVGFFSTGDQIPKSFGLAGVTSRLKVPNLFKIDGPNKSTYTFTPIADAYYNSYAGAPPSPTAGWQNIFGKLDAPFFEDLQLHLQTSCHTNGVAASNAPIYLSGGWPRAGTSNPNHGWLDPSGRTPFETNSFDWTNRGWPSTAPSIAEYRDNSSSEEWHPRAQRLWLGVVDFDYPLSWNFTLRSFRSWQQIEDDFFVLQIQHEITYMDAKECSLDFGAQYDGLPKISIANLAFNALDEATGVAHAIVDAATQPVHDLLSTGLDQLNQVLDTQMNRLMDGVFDRTVDPIIDTLYNTLSNQWAITWNSLGIAQKQQFLQSVSSNSANILIGNGIAPIANNLTTVLKDVGSAVGEANNLIHQVETYLGNASNAVCAIVDVINVTTNGQPLSGPVTGLLAQVTGNRPILPGLVGSLVQDIAPEFINAVIGPTLSNVLHEVEPQLTQITDALQTTKSTIASVEAQLHSAGEFTTEIDNTIKSYSSELSNVTAQVSLQLTQYLGQLNFNVDNPFTHISSADVKKFVRQKIEDEFFATTASAKVQEIMRQRLYDLDAAMREQVDSVFQQVNDVMRELISQSLAELDNSINSALGDISDVMGAGKISGHALINGDSLKLLRIDAHFEWKAPDSMEFNAYLQIKEYDSDGTPGCSSSNAPYTEVTIGADDVSLDWISPDLSCSIATKFTFDGTVPFPVNFGGSLELNGDLSFEAFVLHDLAAALAFGKYENYIALKGGVRFNGYDFSGAVFFGRTCTLDPITLIDPDVASVLGQPPFTGGYVYAQGWLPVSELVLGIPASCLFEISAGVGAGAFYFVEGPTYGGKMFLGVSGSLLCIVSIEGDITMIGVKHGNDLQFKGKGHFEAEIGPCPFCISISKDVSISYVNKSWHFD